MTLQTSAELLAISQLLAAAPAPPASVPRPAPDWLKGTPTSQSALDDPLGWYQHSIATAPGASGVRAVNLAVKHLSPVERAETRAFTRHTLDSTDDRIHPFRLPADTYTFAPPSWSVFVKADQHIVTHAGVLYRVIQVGDVRVPVGGIGGMMVLPEWRGRGYARLAMAHATAFIAAQLWAPFALVICPREHTGFYEALGWRVAEAPIWCAQPGDRVMLANEVAVYLACQGDAEWPGGPIDLCGAPW